VGCTGHVAARLPLAETLLRAMEALKATITPAGSAPALSWREREHDDLVLAVALAAWQGERTAPEAGQPLVFDDVVVPAPWRRW
jgi:hypothetical protein